MGGERGVTARTTKLPRGTIGGCWDALPPCRGRAAAACGRWMRGVPDSSLAEQTVRLLSHRRAESGA